MIYYPKFRKGLPVWRFVWKQCHVQGRCIEKEES